MYIFLKTLISKTISLFLPMACRSTCVVPVVPVGGPADLQGSAGQPVSGMLSDWR